jgi:iron complex outermembrane recepter protein
MFGRGWGQSGPGGRLTRGVGASVVALAFAAGAQAQTTSPPDSVEALRGLSIDQLGQIQVTSAAKTPQALSAAPAAIYVITHDDIIRSGATSIPEMLRLAPNLQVMQVSASRYIITARGFSGNITDQNFTNKLLVMIDGRTVYSPLFSGVYWDMQDVLPEDIDRIEVISGPGATLWGANAVNGVINIITKRASETQGLLVDAGGGNQEESIAAQYGGKVGDNLAYRLYAKAFRDYDTVTTTGAPADDGWTNVQGGFRLDWAASARDAVTFQGDAYNGSEEQPGAPDATISGDNLLWRWTHDWRDGSNLQVQGYYDHVVRGTALSSSKFTIDTWDIDVQDSFNLGPRNAIVVGGGLRASHYDIVGTPTLFFVPANHDLDLANLFIQDTISLTRRVSLIAGLKLEDDPYTGATLLPDLRLSWRPTDNTLLWAAVSRAVRSATPFDRDVVEKIGPTVFLTGGPDFQPETLIAYEAGGRVQISDRLSLSVSAYYNDYDDLKNIEFTPVVFIPLHWGNGMRGYTWGVEAWGEYKVTPWWRLDASIDDLEEHLSFAPGASTLLGTAQAGDDPEIQAQLRSSMNIGPRVTWDAMLRYQSALPDPALPAYAELNMRLGWRVNAHVELSVSGFNLLHANHLEFPASEGATAIPRSVFAELRLHF